MPLSDHEQRILQEIERSFYTHDPGFASKVSPQGMALRAARNCKAAAVAFGLGLIVVLTSFAASVWLGFLGFLLMLASAFVFERNLRKLGKAGLKDLGSSPGAKRAAGKVGDARRRLLSRFQRPR